MLREWWRRCATIHEWTLAAEVTKLWDPMPGETPVQYEAFIIYRGLGPKRTYKSAAKAVGCGVQALGEWARKYRWDQRVNGWLVEKDRKLQREEVEQAQRIQKDHFFLGTQLIKRGKRILKQIKDEEVSAAQLVQIFKLGHDMRQTSIGEPTEIHGNKLTEKEEELVAAQAELIKNLDYDQLIQLRAWIEEGVAGSGGQRDPEPPQVRSEPS